MKRRYRMTKKPTEDQMRETIREILELSHVKSAEFIDEGAVLQVEAEEGTYPEVMSCIVNICNHAAGGAELSFIGFTME